MSFEMNKKWAVCSALTGMVSIQCGASIAKMLFHLLGPAGAVVLRVGFAGILLAIFMRPKFFQFTKHQWGCFLFYGASIGLMNLTYYYGIQRVPLGVAVALEFAGPLSVALIASRKKTDFLWAFLAAVGILLIAPIHAGSNVDPVGIAFVAMAGVMWGLYIVASSRIANRVKSTDAVTCGMLIATVITLPFGIFSGDLFQLDWKMVGLGLGVAILSSALPFTMDLLAMQKLPAKTFSILQSLQPVFAALAGLVFLHEILSLTQCVAILCIMVASVGATICSPAKK